MKGITIFDIRINRITISISLIFLITGTIYSQGDLQKDVKVVKPYVPTLSDASKINLLPEFSDTLRVVPQFDYKIYPRKYETGFRINPIKPATLVGLPLAKLYKSQLTLGVGNYTTPLAEYIYNLERSKTTAMGIYFRHQSSNGKVKLENGLKTDSDYSDNIARVFAKKMYYRSVVEGSLSGGYNSVLYYGYEPAIDTSLIEEDIKQKIYTGGARIRYYSSNPDSSHMNYDAGLSYDFISDRFDTREHSFNLGMKMGTMIKETFAGGDLQLRYFDFNGQVDTTSNFIIDLSPYFSRQTSEWRFLLGLIFSVDSREKTRVGVYPRAEFEFNIVKDVLVPYLGLDGRREVNNYRKIMFENPYIKPGSRFRNSEYSLIGYAGLKGRFSSQLTYNIKASYSRIDSMYFYRNDDSDTLRNQFVPDYDNVSLLALNGELTWHPSNKLQILLKAGYFDYDPEVLLKAWHKAAFQASCGAGYNIGDKILTSGSIFYSGRRYAAGLTSDPIEMKPYLDANLSVDYRYTKILSFFLRLNNFTASRYQIWNQYPVQRFQFLLGFSYAL